MKSGLLTVVDDKPGYFGDAGEYHYAMPTPPMKEHGNWINTVYDVYDLHTNRDIFDIFTHKKHHLKTECNRDLIYISGSDHLFTSRTPNGDFTEYLTDDYEKRGNAFQMRWASTGSRTVMFGAFSNVQNLYSHSQKARWTKAVGISCSFRSLIYHNRYSNFKINNLFLRYKKFGDVTHYYAPIIENSKYCGEHHSEGPDLIYDNVTDTAMEQHISAYVPDSYAYHIRDLDATCTGMLLNFESSGDAGMDMFNFRLHYSHHDVEKNHSLTIIPAPTTLDEREDIHSIPIL